MLTEWIVTRVVVMLQMNKWYNFWCLNNWLKNHCLSCWTMWCRLGWLLSRSQVLTQPVFSGSACLYRSHGSPFFWTVRLWDSLDHGGSTLPPSQTFFIWDSGTNIYILRMGKSFLPNSPHGSHFDNQPFWFQEKLIFSSFLFFNFFSV